MSRPLRRRLGKRNEKGSGTRSGLLWEIERIGKGLHEQGRLPEYLLIENVRTIKAESNIADLRQWLDFLESIGYSNDECMLLNALDFDVPQDRERAFIVSHLGEKLNVEQCIVKQPRKYILENYFRNDYHQPFEISSTFIPSLPFSENGLNNIPHFPAGKAVPLRATVLFFSF